MIPHGPVKRQEALVSFSKDHHFGLLLVWKIRTGLQKKISPERIGNYVIYFFRNDLDNHFKDEECYLFTLLPEDNMLRIQAETEHQKLYKLADAITQDKGDTTYLHEFADLLEAHIRFEERILFNQLQQMVPAEPLQKVSVKHHNSVETLDSAWNDAFWKR